MAANSFNAQGSAQITPAEMNNIMETIPHQNQRVILVAAGRKSSLQSFERSRLPNSVLFNLDEICDTTSKYPVMLPDSNAFTAAMRRLGIRPDDMLIVYDSADVGIYFAPRVVWMLACFGYNSVKVLNTFRKYVEDGYPHCSGPFPCEIDSDDSPTPLPPDLVLDKTRIVCYEELRNLISKGDENYQILDSRPRERFFGTAEGDGHMPGAINVPMVSLLDSAKSLLPVQALRNALVEAGVDEKKTAILSCNTGVTASVVWLALRESGYGPGARLYDGSWSEWKDLSRGSDLIVCDELQRS